MHKLNACPWPGDGVGVKQREEFTSQPWRAVKTSFTNGGVFVQVSVHGKI